MTKAPKMTKAHFKFLAGLMAEIEPASDTIEHDQWLQTVKAMTLALTWTNPTFDQTKFIDECGVR